MTKFSGANAPPDVHQKELMLARQTLELAALLCIRKEDVTGFERHIAQVKAYYTDFKYTTRTSCVLLMFDLVRNCLRVNGNTHCWV